ncbi:hypothetical protein GWI33_008716 [Rhynchophorus ferrugineus]|uniref:Uncharacterized protein n=1 Tax=Rhynchophorus ferrugineus TaxID=354439 RepID=A0A834IBN3_RHYFE|nr:hypothetical protein GWI33_008716 [Rhynchophorus ferrugineus]
MRADNPKAINKRCQNLCRPRQMVDRLVPLQIDVWDATRGVRRDIEGRSFTQAAYYSLEATHQDNPQD